MTAARHAAWICGFSRIREDFEFEAPPGLTTLDGARAKLEAAVAAGAHERGWYADCSTAVQGCGWRGSDRATEEEARADAREHDPESYDERVERTAKKGAERAEVAARRKRSAERTAKKGAERAEVAARRKRSAERQPYHEETLARLYDEVVAAERAWEADLANGELAKAYRSAKSRFRAAEKEATDDFYTIPCGRCGGTGVVPPWGVCFSCGGGKRWDYRTQKFQADPAIRARRLEKARAKETAEEAAYQEALAKLPTAVAEALVAAEAERKATLESFDDGYQNLPSRETEFRADLAHKLRRFGSLSEKQVAAVERGLARDRQRADEKEALKSAPPLETGRRVVEGEVLSDKWSEDRGYGSQHKILVRQDDGNKVWGTLPRALEEKLQRGDHFDTAGMWQDVDPEVTELRGSRVRLTATVEASRDDPHFGFFKRPNGATFLTTEEER